ncbi:MAG: family transcriptional regulator, cyclic receptor protein [Actinomycetota bacterium]|jgi:CRP-like cAMP-binding protein|nr:family transcriptional regulator, cyclic receptor protein [Actinomycetota bacterium]
MAKNRMRDRQRAATVVTSAIESALANTSLFSLCSVRELRLIAKVAKTREVPSGTTLLVEGEVGEEMLAILTGSATVHRGGRKIATLSPGDVVGELGVLVRAPRNATVTTTSDSEVAVIGRRALNRLLADAPGFARKLLEALAERVRELDRHIVS